MRKGRAGDEGRLRRVARATVAASARLRELFPLTTLGLAVVALAAIALRELAFHELDLVALVLGWGAIGLVVASTVLVLLAAIGLAIHLPRGRVGTPVRGETRMWMPTDFQLPTLGFVPLVTVDGCVVAPEGIERDLVARDGRWLERLSLSTRGIHEVLDRRVTVGDVFGLARITLRRSEPRTLFVQPHLGRLGTMPTLRSLATGDALAHPSGMPEGDRIDLRRYAPGDPARFIHWKIFGRTRKLVVRVPERAIAPSRRVVAYLVAGPSDEASAAAALAAVRYGALGEDWAFGADVSPRPTSDVDEAIRYVVRSVEARDDGARDLDAFLRLVSRDGPTSLVVFVPPRPGPWLDRLLAAGRPLGTPMQVVIGVDVLATGPGPGRLWRFLATPVDDAGLDRADLDAVRTRLSASGADVVVVERPTGRVLEAHGQRSTVFTGVAA